MKRMRNGLVMFLVVFILPLVFAGCNGFGSPDFTMTVVLEDESTGTPDAGTYTFDEFEEVDYNYLPADENVQIEVLVNGNPRLPYGQFVMYNDINVVVRIIDIRGEWAFEYLVEDGSNLEMDITFEGSTPFEGTFTDSRGYTGIWKVEKDDLTMTYNNWADYVFTGYISSMSGNYKGEGIELTWNASRKE